MKKAERKQVIDEFFEKLLKKDNASTNLGARASVANFRASISKLKVIADLVDASDTFSYEVDEVNDVVKIKVFGKELLLIAERSSDPKAKRNAIFNVYESTTGLNPKPTSFFEEEQASGHVIGLIASKFSEKNWQTYLPKIMDTLH